MSDKIIYELFNRDTENVKRLRKEGKIPGVIYGAHLKGGKSFYMEEKVLSEMLRKNTKSSTLSVKIDGVLGNAIVKEVQRHPLNGSLLHVDLQGIGKDEILTLTIPLKYVNEDEVTFRNLITNINFNDIQVKGEADKLPEVIEIDLAGQTPDARFTAGDLVLAEGLHLVTPADELLYTISEPKTQEKEAAAEESEVPAAPAE